MEHEFGHVVALATSEFRRYQRTQMKSEADFELTSQHREEFFADLFALYTLGPAFACAAITLRFSPFEAYWERGAHPMHQERVKVILGALEEVSAYDGIRNQLERGWDATVKACGAEPTDPQQLAWAKRRLERAKRWGHGLYKIIDQFFRLGDQYTPERWQCACKLADRLAEDSSLTFRELALIAKHKDGVQPLKLDDLLNALWWARVKSVRQFDEIGLLTSVAYQLGRDILNKDNL